jgi:LuxR family maltose regulon positive regulatory protein
VPIPDLQIPEIRELEIVTWAELRLAQGRAAEVGRGLEQFLEAMVNQGRHGSAMAVRVCLATLHAQLGRMAPAITVLEPALTLAEREGYVRVFADAGIALFPALRRATARGIAPEWGGRLLAALGAASATTDQPPGSVSPSFVEPLSEREREVLRLLAAGHSNATIAGHLFLSVGTVKRHVHNIYGKLGATSRTSAAARARTLCLL